MAGCGGWVSCFEPSHHQVTVNMLSGKWASGQGNEECQADAYVHRAA